MAFSNAAKGAPRSEINVTPLIDVLLVLLIVFMVIVPLAPRGLDSSIPQKSRAEAAALPAVVVRVEPGGAGGAVAYSINRRTMGFAELRPALHALLEVRPGGTLFIEGDRNLSYRQIAEVVGEAREAGAGQVALLGSPEEAARP